MDFPSFDTKSIAIQSDGAKLAWSVLAFLASLGLGLYISSVVSPIKNSVAALERDMVTCQGNTRALNDLILNKFRHNK